MRKFNKVKRFCRKNRNWIFAIGEIGLATGSIIFAVKGSKLYMDQYEPNCKSAVKAYWPAAACYAGFVTLRIFDAMSTTRIQRDYASALVGLGTMAAGVSQNYITGLPEEKHSVIKKEIKDSGKDYKIFFYGDELPALAEFTNGSKTPSPGCDDFFYIPQFDILVCSNMYDMENAEEEARLQYESDQDVYLNDILEYMGVEKKGFGEDYYIPGCDHNFGDNDEPFTFDFAPSMTIDDDSTLFYTINFNKKFRNVYEVN